MSTPPAKFDKEPCRAKPTARPAATIGGYRIGAKSDEKLYVKLSPRTTGGNSEFEATLTPNGFKKYVATPDILNPSAAQVNNKAQDAANLIEANKEFIAYEAYGYITAKYPALLVKQSIQIVKCRRDIGYLLDATIQDLRLGGNINTIQAAESYYVKSGGVENLTYINNELNETDIVGFNVYHGYDEDSINYIFSQTTTSYSSVDLLSGIFCISIFDRFENESELVCTYASEYFSFFYDLHEGANLISFPYLPESTEVGDVFENITYAIDGVIAEGSAAYFYQNIQQWIGSLSNLDFKSGYWIKIDPDLNQSSIILNVQGFPYSQESITYNLNEGYNLISYIGQDNLNIEDAIPPELIQFITSIIGEGVASIYNSQLNQWLGNLNELKFGKGYWIESNADIEFQWTNPELTNFNLKQSK